MLSQLRKHLPYIEAISFEDLQEFGHYKLIPKFQLIKPDIFDFLIVLEIDPYDHSGKYDKVLLGIVTTSNLIRKDVYEDLQKKTSEYRLIGFMMLKNGKIHAHAVGEYPKEPKNEHYEIKFKEWTMLSKLKPSTSYWIKPSNAKRVAETLSIMLNKKTIWVDELHTQVSDIGFAKLGLILRKLGLATRRVYDSPTKRLRRKIITPRRMLKTTIEQYHIS